MQQTDSFSMLHPLIVRLIGLEPTRRETPDPKSGASTNFATSAWKTFPTAKLSKKDKTAK